MTDLPADEATSRFVIQRHEREGEHHFDIMIEGDGTLRTWSSPRPPGEGPVKVRALPDHRIEYLTYEGEVSGGRGSVRIWDRGTCEIEVWEEDRVVVGLLGERCRGRLTIARERGDLWAMRFPDPTS